MTNFIKFHGETLTAMSDYLFILFIYFLFIYFSILLFILVNKFTKGWHLALGNF